MAERIAYAHIGIDCAFWLEIVDKRDGTILKDVVEANADEGWVVFNQRDDRGHLVIGADHRAETVKIEGLDIEIRFPPHAPEDAISWFHEAAELHSIYAGA